MTDSKKTVKLADGDLSQHVASPLLAAEVLSLSTPVKKEVQCRWNSSKDELFMTARAPAATTAAATIASVTTTAKLLTPPVSFGTVTDKAMDPLRLPQFSLSARREYWEPPQLEQQWEEHVHSDVAAAVERTDRVPATGSRLLTSTTHEEEQQQQDQSESNAAPRRFPEGERQPKEFQCPHVPHMVLVLLVFSALVQGFSGSAISLFINMELALGPVEVTRYWMYIGYTAWCQPAIGYLSDALVLFGEKRRPLFVLAAAGNTVIFFLYCTTPAVTSTYGRFVVMSIVSQFFTMGLYIPLNGLVVEVGRHDAETEEESMARMSAIMSKTMVWRSVGSLVGNILQTVLVLYLSLSSLLGVTSFFFAILIPIVLITPRRLFLRTGTQDQNFYKRVVEAGRLVWRSFDIHDVRSDGVCFVVVLFFVFVYTMMPDAGSVYYNYLYGAFTFPAWFYALNNCIGFLGSIAGAYVFSVWMDHRARQETRGGTRTSLFFIFMIGSFAWAFGYATNLLLCTGFVTETLGIPTKVYVPVDNFFMSMFVRFAFMPTITMAAEHAPKFFEATTFEVFSVASICGGTISSLLTSNLAQDLGISRSNYSKLWVLIVISIVLKLVPIPLAYLLPERRSSAEEQPTVIGDEDGDTGEKDDGETEKAGSTANTATEAEAAAATSHRCIVSAVAAAASSAQNESSRISQESDDICSPSVPLTRNLRNLI